MTSHMNLQQRKIKQENPQQLFTALCLKPRKMDDENTDVRSALGAWKVPGLEN